MNKQTLKERADGLKRDIPAVFLALKDKRTPVIPKFLALITVVYALSPVDLIPDFIPVIGFLDDLIILPALITATVKLIPKDVFNDCRQRSAGQWQDGKPKKWYYAIPFVLFWILLAAFILSLIF